jgi:hypothetical protein
MTPVNHIDTTAPQLMIDIETLALSPCPGAVIPSIGAVVFNQSGPFASLYVTIDRDSCRNAGLVTDEETVEWWADQPAEVRDATMQDEYSLDTALAMLTEFYTAHQVEAVWANPPAFDAVLLQSAYRAIDKSPPWTDWELQSYQTLEEIGLVPALDRPGEHHHALADAIYQAWVATGALSRLTRLFRSNPTALETMTGLGPCSDCQTAFELAPTEDRHQTAIRCPNYENTVTWSL